MLYCVSAMSGVVVCSKNDLGFIKKQRKRGEKEREKSAENGEIPLWVASLK